MTKKQYKTSSKGLLLMVLVITAMNSALIPNTTQAQEPLLKLVMFGLPATVPADGSRYESLVVSAKFSDGTAMPLPKGIVVSLSSSNTAVGDVDKEVTIPAGEFFTLAKFRSTLSPGKTVITASAQGLSVGSVTIETVRPAGSPARLSVHLAPDALPPGGRSSAIVIVQLLDATGIPAEARTRTNVSLSSSRASVGELIGSVIIPDGKTFVETRFNAGNLPGNTIITASASGFVAGSATMAVVGPQPSKLAVFTAPKRIASIGEEGLVTIQLQDPDGIPAKAPTDLTVQILLSNSSIGSIDPEVVILQGSSSSLVKFTSSSLIGRTRITAVSPGLNSGFGDIEVIKGSSVANALRVHFAPPLLLAEKAVHKAVIIQRVSGMGSPAVSNQPTNVLLSSSRPFVGTVTPRTTIPSGKSYAVAEFNSTFLSGTTDITAVAQDLDAVTANMTTTGPQPSQLVTKAIPPILKATGEVYYSILVGLQDAKGIPSRAPDDIPVILTSSRPDVGTVQSVVFVQQGSSYTFVQFNSTTRPGQTTITATSSGYIPVSTDVRTVEPYPSKLTLSLAPNPLLADERSYNNLVIQLQDAREVPADPRENVEVILHTSNVGVGTIPSKVTIPRGETYVRIPFQTTNVPGETTIVSISRGFTTGTIKVSTFVLPSNVAITLEPAALLSGIPSKVHVSVSSVQGKPISGAALQWSTTLGTLVPESKVTDGNGRALASLTPLRSGKGMVSVTALKPGFQVGSFTLETVVGEPERPTGTPSYVLVLYAAISILPAGLIALWFFRFRRKPKSLLQ